MNMTEKTVCKHCKSENIKVRKTWILEGKIKGYRYRIFLYDCLACGKSFRTAKREA
jgi:hypothetical protein